MLGKRVLRSKLGYSIPHELLLVEIAVENVIDYLNETEDYCQESEKSRQRVRELIENLKILTSQEVVATARSRKKFSKEIRFAIDAVDKELDEYPATPALNWSPEGQLSFGHDFKKTRKGAEHLPGAAYSAMKLAEMGQVHQVRQCICGRWFFARTQNQKSCSSKCRHKLYERTAENRARRREYMRDYRRRDKERELKARQLAARQKGR
jgi:predicted RNA-binding Zn ribbon-like protein